MCHPPACLAASSQPLLLFGAVKIERLALVVTIAVVLELRTRSLRFDLVLPLRDRTGHIQIITPPRQTAVSGPSWTFPLRSRLQQSDSRRCYRAH